MTVSVPSFQRHGTSRPWRCTPPIQRSIPLRATWSTRPSSTRRPTSVRVSRVCLSTRTTGRLGLEQRVGGAREAGYRLVRPGIAEERPRLSGADAEERGAGRRWALCHGGQDATLGQRQPVARGGVFAAESIEGLGHEAQLAYGRRRDLAEPAGIRSPEEPPRPRGVLERRRGQRRRGHRRQPAELIGIELAQAAEVGDAGVLTDADERRPVGRHVQRMEPGDDLDQLQLVVEIGFEPQHVPAVAVRLQRAGRARRAHPRSRDPPRSRPPESARGCDGARRRRRPAPGLRATRRASTGCDVRARLRAAPARWNRRSSRATPSPTSDRFRAAAPRASGRARPRTTRPSWPCGPARVA